MGMFRDESRGDVKEKRQIKSGVKPVILSEGVSDLNTPTSAPDTSSVEAPLAEAAAGATLFVKNLSFSTGIDKLVKTFRSLPSFVFARVQQKPDPKHPGQTLSMGYGFVGFKDKNAATKALSTMQGFVLDGHALVVKFAQRGADDADKGKKDLVGVGKSSTAKMIVKNLPFEATKKDVRELFGLVAILFCL